MAKSNHDIMWTSISAIEDAGGKYGDAGCIRRWWFNKCMKMPKPKKKATIFGDVLHAVNARYLIADDRGLINGKPVILYPEGWMSAKEKFGTDDTVYTITPAEAALIQTLVDTAISEGILIREPGRRVECELGENLIRDFGQDIFGRYIYIDEQKNLKVLLKGFIDLETPKKVEDHKSAKKLEEPYCVPLKKLKKTLQLMMYSLDKYERGHKGNLWIVHNNFIKDFDKPQVVRREDEVTEEEVYTFYQDVILPIVKRMVKIYTEYSPDKINRWADISGPFNTEKECNRYYGKPCPYLNICAGVCTVKAYLDSYKEVRNIVETETNYGKVGNSMSSLIDKIKQANGALKAAPTTTPATPPVTNTTLAIAPAPIATGGLAGILSKMKPASLPVEPPPAAVVTPPAEIAPVVAPAPVTPPAEAEATVKQRAPWYMTDGDKPCQACGTNEIQGFNTAGNACRVCDARAKLAGKPTSSDYKIDVLPDGMLQFTLLVGTSAPETVTIAKPVETKTQVAPPAPVSAPTPVTIPAPAPAVIEGPFSAGQQQSGFTLLIGCTIVKNDGLKVLQADDILQAALEFVASVAQKPLESIEHFALLEALDAYIPQIVPQLAGQTVFSFVPGKSTALARLLDGLRPYASKIIVPMAV